jgi:hypothetical protein
LSCSERSRYINFDARICCEQVTVVIDAHHNPTVREHLARILLMASA